MSVRINCKLPNGRLCAKCCFGTQMPLTSEDIERIKSLGFKEQEFVFYKGVMPTLKNASGHCVFLDASSGACKIYSHRPIGCRLYPLVYDAERNKVVADPHCPMSTKVSSKVVLGHGRLVRKIALEIMKKASDATR